MNKALVRQAFASINVQAVASQKFTDDMQVEDLDRMLRESLEGAGWTVDLKRYAVPIPKAIKKSFGAQVQWFHFVAKGEGQNVQNEVQVYGLAINRSILTASGLDIGGFRAVTLLSRTQIQDFVVAAWKRTSGSVKKIKTKKIK